MADGSHDTKALRAQIGISHAEEKRIAQALSQGLILPGPTLARLGACAERYGLPMPLAEPECTPSRNTSTVRSPATRPRREVVLQSWS